MVVDREEERGERGEGERGGEEEVEMAEGSRAGAGNGRIALGSGLAGCWWGWGRWFERAREGSSAQNSQPSLCVLLMTINHIEMPSRAAKRKQLITTIR